MTRLEDSYKVAVIGAGPAGIVAAIFAAKSGASVVLLEKNDRVGRKILATGNGRCNITNQNITIDRYHGKNVSFAAPIFASFNQQEAMKYFESIGIVLKEEDRGRMFPKSDQASSIVEALESQLASTGVMVKTSFTVKNIEKNQKWHIVSENGESFDAESLVLATGGKAAYQLGSSGDGLFWARNLGHEIIPIHAALVPVITEEATKDIMGIRLVSNASLFADGKLITQRSGDILFTHFGISGPAAMGLARDADIMLSEGKRVEISLDITPEYEADQLDEMIASIANIDGKKNVKNVLSGLFSKNLVNYILSKLNIDSETKAAELSKKQRREIVGIFKDFRFTIKGVRPLKEAQVMAGGVNTDELTAHLESKIVPGLYFAGEIIDIDGDSGGFNLQWAWSSGKVAGTAAAGALNE